MPASTENFAIPLAQLSLKINGQTASDALMADLKEVAIDHSLHLPSMFTIRMYSSDMAWMDDGTFPMGATVEISAGYSSVEKLISAKVSAIEPELDIDDPCVVIRGYDLYHKLYRGRHTKAFVQVSDSDMATTIAGQVGLTPTVDSTTEVYDYVLQQNQTHAEFLLERARRIGYELWVDNQTLYFRKPPSSGAAISLAWGKELINFRARLSVSEQINQVEVHGWDPKTKQAISGSATTGSGSPAIGESQTGANLGSSSWGQAKLKIVEYNMHSNSDATTRAQAQLDELTSGFVAAEGMCLGDPQILPGKRVQISSVGAKFSGTYYVTSVKHVYNAQNGFTTQFAVSGRRDRGLWSLVDDFKPQHKPTGMVVGLVTNNKDPDEMGRVKVKFPWLLDDNGQPVESFWARIVTPMAGNARGILYLPEVNDEVLVGFQNGDINYPYVMGAVWNGQDKLPLNQAEAVGGDGKVNKRILKTRATHTLTFDDTENAEIITLKSKSGHTFSMDDKPNEEKITVQSKSGHVITIDDTSSAPKVTIKSKAGHTVTLNDTAGSEEITIVDKTTSNKIEIKSTDNSIHLTAMGDIKIQATGKVSISGTGGVDVSSTAKTTIGGQGGVDVTTPAQLKLSGTGTAELSSAGETTVKGGLLQVESMGPAAIKGNPVAIN